MRETVLTVIILNFLFLIPIAASTVLLVNSMVSKIDDSWFNEKSRSKKEWKKINFLSFFVSSTFGILTQLIMYKDFDNDFTVIASISSSLLTYITVQSFFTDFYDRRVDRKGLRISCLISAVFGFYLIFQNDPIYMFLYVIYILLATSTFFIRSPVTKKLYVSQSDSRAIILVVLAAFPILGINYFNTAALMVALMVILYGVFAALKNRDFGILYKKKISIPMVPLIVAPFSLAVTFSHVLELL